MTHFDYIVWSIYTDWGCGPHRRTRTARSALRRWTSPTSISSPASVATRSCCLPLLCISGFAETIYQICRFCWHHIKENLNGKCPACRRDYTEEGVQFKAINQDE